MMSIYLLPIFLINLLYKKIVVNKNIILSFIMSVIIVLILIYFFEPFPNWLGGGVVYQLSIKLFGNYYLFYFSSLFTFFIFIYFGLENKKNIILATILLFVFFSLQAYQRYYEPMLYLIIFTLFQTKYTDIIFEKTTASIILLLYYMVYYFGSVSDIIYKF